MEPIDTNQKKKITLAINFLEELNWLFESKKVSEFKDIPNILRNLVDYRINSTINQKYISPSPNKNFLIGVLPALFQDEELFKTREELIDFAVNVLKIKMKKSSNRSRFEYIGLIVCEVTKLNDANLSKLVEALSRITGSNEKIKLIKEAKKLSNFSWNETIQKLSK